MNAKLVGLVAASVRRAKRLTQTEVAAKAGLSVHWVSKIENGGLVSDKARRKVLLALNCPAHSLRILTLTSDELDADAVRQEVQSYHSRLLGTYQRWSQAFAGRGLNLDALRDLVVKLNDLALWHSVGSDGWVERAAAAIVAVGESEAAIEETTRRLGQLTRDHIDGRRQGPYTVTSFVPDSSTVPVTALLPASPGYLLEGAAIGPDRVVGLIQELHPTDSEIAILCARADARLGISPGDLLIVASSTARSAAGVGADASGHHLLWNGHGPNGGLVQQEYEIRRVVGGLVDLSRIVDGLSYESESFWRALRSAAGVPEPAVAGAVGK